MLVDTIVFCVVIVQKLIVFVLDVDLEGSKSSIELDLIQLILLHQMVCRLLVKPITVGPIENSLSPVVCQEGLEPVFPKNR